jgi:hypothetical protein
MKSMPVFLGTIRNVTYENLVLHNVRTGVCINTAEQSCYSKDGKDGGGGTVRVGMADDGLGFMNVEGKSA